MLLLNLVSCLRGAVPFPPVKETEREGSPFFSQGEGKASRTPFNFTKGETGVRQIRVVYQLRLLTSCR